jgi:hypothetical protein
MLSSHEGFDQDNVNFTRTLLSPWSVRPCEVAFLKS